MEDSPHDDLSLLRNFEPVVRFTAGELFFPTAVETYVAQSALWEIERNGPVRCVVPNGALSIKRLVDEAAGRPSAELSLRFVATPLGRRELRSWRKRPDRPRFSSRGRFTQVGIMSRLLDALLRLVLLLRGRVPGGLAAAAESAYRSRLDPNHHPYYGRVVRDGGYIVLQYWYFYAMNDWRSSFGGANDHEADWEQVTIYLVEHDEAEQEGHGPRPEWVAFSAHDEVGDDLRRRWDDPELVREGDHTVVFAGAGSHSGAFVAGEYVTAVDPPGALDNVLRVIRSIAAVIMPWSRGEIARGVGIPFVDYSRGDGDVIGEHHERTWTAVLVDDATPWIVRYRGLWGPRHPRPFRRRAGSGRTALRARRRNSPVVVRSARLGGAAEGRSHAGRVSRSPAGPRRRDQTRSRHPRHRRRASTSRAATPRLRSGIDRRSRRHGVAGGRSARAHRQGRTGASRRRRDQNRVGRRTLGAPRHS